MKTKLNKKTKRTIIVTSTIVGVIALFLIVAFIPIDSTPVSSIDDEQVESNIEDKDKSMSKNQLEKRVKELEQENAELKADVEKYKILAEQTTKAISSPTVGTSNKSSNKSDDDSKKTDKSDDKFYDSSEYYDKDYKDYITDNDNDEKGSSSDKKDNSKSDANNNSSNTDSSITSDNGL